MGLIRESAAGLRIFGDELQPAEISRMLKCEPTQARVKGEVIKYPSGRERKITCGSWLLTAKRTEPEDLDGQIKWLLAKMTNDLMVWQALTSSYDVDMFCGAFMQSTNDGLSISPETMFALGSRGIEFDLDIYGPDDDSDGDV
ncbi:DUF4279 domain-containing protein [Janthinobacterium lividum]|uniref:DUF4279 domain-containing protein n=1 Tax=Janthinobacterium lividum TaxID=29581 RepID=UPI0024AE88EB|nr:DUF4279 domain-containing protein [Janthinobacterium lividum]